MAICNHIPDKKLLEVFPELSQTESNVMALYSLGMTPAIIAQSQNKSVSTVNNHLANIKLKLSTNSAFDLRTLFMIRLMMKMIDGIDGNLSEIFSTLNSNQVDVVLMHASGSSEQAISYERHISSDSVSELLDSATTELGLKDTDMIKAYVCMKLTEHMMKVIH
ncbi:TraA protein [Buttiauxella sp. B2]|uniref:helix-turn-helix transcriptional regulator n=1 Tax=Buttiauxella sp. B2 TaxID=2587812 RepID=UPI0011239A97|nr:LuxR C-terminal-related transcriptional regulator [Buttiauxella sp. B2]TNV16112.1 TraA protein [Buttiauxella sp. B2]